MDLLLIHGISNESIHVDLLRQEHCLLSLTVVQELNDARPVVDRVDHARHVDDSLGLDLGNAEEAGCVLCEL